MRAGGLKAWQGSGRGMGAIDSVRAVTLKEQIENGAPVFDVRKDGEFETSHIPSAKHTSLECINKHLDECPKDKPFDIHCAGGYRSVIAASILKSRGIHNGIDVAGGFKAIKEADIAIEIQ